MKKELKAVLCVVLSVWFFVMGFELGVYREKKNANKIQTQTVTPEQVQQIPQSEVLATDEPLYQPEPSTDFQAELPTLPDVPSTELPTLPPLTEPQPPAKEDVSTLTKAQIIQRTNTAVTALKNEKNLKARNVENISITVTDCSVSALVGVINNTLKRFVGESTANYNFVNGQATGIDDKGKTIKGEEAVSPRDVIPPSGMDFAITEAGVVSATAAEQGDNIVYTMKIVEEKATLENPVPPNTSKAVGYLNLAAVDLPGVKIAEANMIYKSATLSVTVNKEGKVISLHNYLPMDGNGVASLGRLSGNASFTGGADDYWEFSY